MKPHLLLWLRQGVTHSEVGSWLQAIADPSVAGPPFQPDVDRTLAGHTGGVLVVHEHEPARTDGWSLDEQAVGLDRKFRVVSLVDRLFSTELVAALRELTVVERVEPGQVVGTAVPVAESFSRHPSDWAWEVIGLPEAHRVTRGSPEVTVAVLDTGVDTQHREYADRLEGGFDFVDIIDGADDFFGDRLGADSNAMDPGVGHGSHVTGIIAARGRKMSTGAAPGCRILPVRVLGALRQGDRLIGAGLVDNISTGLKWAVDHGADVINMSLGIRHEGGGLPHGDVVRYAAQKGVMIVAAAGNDGAPTLYYPGALPGVVAVGAVDRDGSVASYSTWGDQVALVAPGTDVWSTWLEDGYAFATGTSQATPFVAGAAALCQSIAHERGRRLSPEQVTAVLTRTADRDARRFKSPRAGYGRLNVPDALRYTIYRLDAAPRRRTAELPNRRQPVPA